MSVAYRPLWCITIAIFFDCVPCAHSCGVWISIDCQLTKTVCNIPVGFWRTLYRTESLKSWIYSNHIHSATWIIIINKRNKLHNPFVDWMDSYVCVCVRVYSGNPGDSFRPNKNRFDTLCMWIGQYSYYCFSCVVICVFKTSVFIENETFWVIFVWNS